MFVSLHYLLSTSEALPEKGLSSHGRDLETEIAVTNLDRILSAVAEDTKNLTFSFGSKRGTEGRGGAGV